MLSRALYSNLLRIAMPVVLGRLLWRALRAPAYRRRWGERFGAGPVLSGRPLWVHAVSVGETIAAVPVVEALLARHPGLPVLVTSTTPTGSARVRAAFGDRVHHCYAPYDTPGAVRRFYDRVRPRLVVIMETEIWPNLLAQAEARAIPVILANARLSARSAQGYARVAGLSRGAIRRITLIAAQSRADARRFHELGAPLERTVVTGSVKFDQPLDPAHVDAGRELRAALGAGRPVWVAASTHAGEEAPVLEAHRRIRSRFPDAALVLVPRHPERFDPAVGAARAAGFATARRSAGDADEATAVLVGDTMGELPALLAAGDVAFVGGSLVPVGGHNLLEPAALRLPVLTGPHVFNFRPVYDLLEEAGAVATVASADALAARVMELSADPAARRRWGEAAAAVVMANRGALERLIEAIEARLATPPSSA